jgi:hypothetical protein
MMAERQRSDGAHPHGETIAPSPGAAGGYPRVVVRAVVVSLALLPLAACAGAQVLGADASGACPPGLRPHGSKQGGAECVSGAAADYALCTQELGLATPRPAVSVHVVQSFPSAAPGGSVTAPSNGQIHVQGDVETVRARADALRGCWHVYFEVPSAPASPARHDR